MQPFTQRREEGEKIQSAELISFAKCLEDCELQEVKSIGTFFTWTNRSTWSKIDTMVANSRWYQEIEYTHISCITEEFSDHTPLKINFPGCPKRRDHFKFCEIWCNDPKYKEIVQMQSQKRRKRNKM